MRRAMLSLVRQPATGGSWHGPDWNSSSKTSLIRQVLNFPVVQRDKPQKADARLVSVASSLLDAHLRRGRYFSADSFSDPAWIIMLYVYVENGQNANLSVTSLSNSPGVGPATVALRWMAKLLDDGVLELTQGASLAGEPIVRLSFDALTKLEEWLAEVRLAPTGGADTPLKI